MHRYGHWDLINFAISAIYSMYMFVTSFVVFITALFSHLTEKLWNKVIYQYWEVLNTYWLKTWTLKHQVFMCEVTLPGLFLCWIPVSVNIIIIKCYSNIFYNRVYSRQWNCWHILILSVSISQTEPFYGAVTIFLFALQSEIREQLIVQQPVMGVSVVLYSISVCFSVFTMSQRAAGKPLCVNYVSICDQWAFQSGNQFCNCSNIFFSIV